MGHELEEPSEQNGSEDAVIEACYTPQEALEQMKKAVADLREGLNSVDTSGEGPLDDPQLGELVAGSAGHTKQILAQLLTKSQERYRVGYPEFIAYSGASFRSPETYGNRPTPMLEMQDIQSDDDVPMSAGPETAPAATAADRGLRAGLPGSTARR
ncbi:hypothetical protein EDB87DRAFT_1691715 [Lactarius vividus]|nr:hypothetical protein EDB87DRAFT_1691715 [Lactarius vividus]